MDVKNYNSMDNIKISHIKTNAQNLEMWVAFDNDINVGHVFINIESNNRIKFMDDWVHPDYRNKGIYRKLWDIRMSYTKDNFTNHLIYAWCKETSLPLFIEKGFKKGEIATYVELK